MPRKDEPKIEGLDKLLKKRLDTNKWMADAITTGMTQAGLALQGQAAILAPVNTGALRQSITTEVDQRPPFASWVAVGPTVSYGRYVEFGRKAGAMPPVDALEPWVRLKLKAANPRRVAYAIALKIAAEGTKAQPYMFPALKNARPENTRILTRLGKEVGKDWGAKIR